MYHELVVLDTPPQQRRLMTDVSSIELDWLFDLVPNNFYTDARKANALLRHQNAVYGGDKKRKFG